MTNRILVAGSVNMDLVLEVEKLPIKGETIAGKTIRYIPGGKGVNQAVATSRLGGNVSFVGKVGEDHFGREMLDFLKAEKLDLVGLRNSSVPTGVAMITVGGQGENTIVIIAGANGEVTPQYIEKQESLVSKSNLVLSQYEIPVPSVEKLFSLAKTHKKITVLNPAPALPTSKDLFKNTDYLVVNEVELAMLTGHSEVVVDEDKVVKLARKLQSKGPKVVVVTIGAKGSLTVADKVIRTEGIRVQAVDTTAAGDCFVGAFAVQISKGTNLEEALDFANRAAAVSVQRWGASSSLPTLEELGG